MADYKCPIYPEWETSSAGMNKHFADTHTGRTTPAADALPSLGTPTEIVEEMRGNQPPAATESIPTTDLVSVDQGKDTSSPEQRNPTVSSGAGSRPTPDYTPAPELPDEMALEDTTVADTLYKRLKPIAAPYDEDGNDIVLRPKQTMPFTGNLAAPEQKNPTMSSGAGSRPTPDYTPAPNTVGERASYGYPQMPTKEVLAEVVRTWPDLRDYVRQERRSAIESFVAKLFGPIKDEDGNYYPGRDFSATDIEDALAEFVREEK